jgi:hypothetical protein
MIGLQTTQASLVAKTYSYDLELMRPFISMNRSA